MFTFVLEAAIIGYMNKHVLRTKQKEQSILKAAIKLVSNQPIEHITVNSIKTTAKASQVTIYKLFGTKENLIVAAIKELSRDAVDSVMKVITSDLKAPERLQEYFRASFNTALSFPRQKELVEYIFSGMNNELMNYVLSLYQPTYPYLKKLYTDAINDKIIRDEISYELFLRMCDMFTRIQPEFYKTATEMDMLVKSIVKSFG